MILSAKFRELFKLALLLGGQLLGCHAALGTVIHVPQVPALEEIWIAPALETVPIDVNGDGNTDLGLHKTFGIGMLTYGAIATYGVVTRVDGSNRVAFVTSLDAGEEIGPTTMEGALAGESWVLDTDHNGFTGRILATGVKTDINSFGGPFLLTRKFMGIRMELAPGEFHYGWVDIENNMAGVWNYRIHGWAWETEPNKPIFAGAVPEPGSIMLMVLSMTCMLGRRNRKLSLVPVRASQQTPVGFRCFFLNFLRLPPCH